MTVATPLVEQLRLDTPETPAFAWEEVPCPLCGCDRTTTVAEAPDAEGPDGLRFPVAECRRCRLWYTNPRPTAATIGRFYSADYKPHRRQGHQRLKTSWVWRAQAFLTGRPCLARQSLPWHGEGRLLDFGCGSGDFLVRMKEQGWDGTAIDVSPLVIARLEREHGIPGHVGTLPHSDVPAEAFDVVTMWASLEHVHQPLEVLHAAYRALRPGGRLYVVVPNAECWDHHLFREHWFSLDLPRHLTHFTRRTLGMTLRRAGFGVIRLGQVSHPSNTRKSLAQVRRAGVDTPYQNLLRIKYVRLLRSWMSYLAGRADHLIAVAERP